MFGIWAFLIIYIFLFCILFLISDTIYFFIRYLVIYGKPKNLKSSFKESSLFVKIFRDFPRLLGRAFYENLNSFEDYGIIIFYGPQGCGKTMATVHYAQKIWAKYPSCKIGSNFHLLIEDFKIKSLKDLIKYNDLDTPQIFCIDEISKWANSRNWQHMDMSVLGEICYNRKHKRLLLGTAQSISMVDRQFRIQSGCGEWRRAFTLKGFITFVFRFKPEFDGDGNLTKKKFKGFYFFLQDEVLRYLYDTLEVVGEQINDMI